MSFDQTKWTWSNGRLIPWADATTHVSAHALHYGSGVFEGLRCYETPDGPAVFRLYDHIERFFSSAAVYGLDIPYNAEELASAVCDVIQRNELRVATCGHFVTSVAAVLDYIPPNVRLK